MKAGSAWPSHAATCFTFRPASKSSDAHVCRPAIILMDTLSDFPKLVAEHEQLAKMIRAGTRPARAHS